MRFATFLLCGCLLSSCGGGSSTSNPAGATVTPISAWDAPCAAPVQGATLSDGWENLCLVPAPVDVGGGWTDSAAITPSGTSLYFGYSRFDFGQFLDSNGATQNPTGVARAGMTGNAFKMFRADLDSSGWTVHFLPFNGDPTVGEASASPNANQDLIVFTRFDSNGVGALYDTSLINGSWSTPANLGTNPAINSPNTSCTNDNGFVVGSLSSGLTLYFESNRDDASGSTCQTYTKNRLYYSTYNSVSGFSAPAEVPGLDGATTNENDTQISLSQDQLTVYFTRANSTAYGVFTGTRTSTSNPFTNVHQIVQPNFASPYTGTLIAVGEANVAVTSQGQVMYMMCGIAQTETSAHDPMIHVCFAKKPI